MKEVEKLRREEEALNSSMFGKIYDTYSYMTKNQSGELKKPIELS